MDKDSMADEMAETFTNGMKYGRDDIKKQALMLIVNEINAARFANEETSRLAGLYLKIEKL